MLTREGGDAGGTNTLSGTSPFSHPRRLLMVIISSWELWQSVSPSGPLWDGDGVTPLPPPTFSTPVVSIWEGRQSSSRKFYGFLVQTELSYFLHHSSVQQGTSRTSWVILKEVNLKRKTSRWSQEPDLLLCSYWATPTLSEDLLCFWSTGRPLNTQFF